MTRTDVLIGRAATAHHTGAGVNYVVKTPAGIYYMVYIDAATSDVVYKKSTDGGATWGSAVTVFTGTVVNLSIWYDRWSNISAGLIHCAYTDSGVDDTLYRSINTESSDALSTETTIFAGASTANGGALSICRARGGNIYCKTTIDAGAEGGFFRSVDVGANWTSRTDNETKGTTDQWILMPGWAADNQDMMLFFVDAGDDALSRVLYDDSANSWSETFILSSGNYLDVVATAGNGSFGHFAAAVDITNSRNLLVAWNQIDIVSSSLKAYHVTEATITTLTNVVAPASNDDQGFCAIGIDTDTEDWYVYYGGLTDGSQTYNTSQTINYKKSTDDGATWGSETPLEGGFAGAELQAISYIYMTPRFNTRSAVAYQNNQLYLGVNVDVPKNIQPTFGIGI